VTVVDVLLIILNVIRRLRVESENPPRLCDHIGIGEAAILIGMPTVKDEASATVIVLLPLVAPEVIGTVGIGGGHCALPKRNAADGLLYTLKIVIPWPAPLSVTLFADQPVKTRLLSRNMPAGAYTT